MTGWFLSLCIGCCLASGLDVTRATQIGPGLCWTHSHQSGTVELHCNDKYLGTWYIKPQIFRNAEGTIVPAPDHLPADYRTDPVPPPAPEPPLPSPLPPNLPDPLAPAKTPATARAQRLSTALRDNLRRRKAAARAVKPAMPSN